MTYEITYLVDTEDKSKSLIDLITSTGATYAETKNWGLRDLAYTIDKHTKAYYYTGTITAVPATIADLKQKINFSNIAMRYLITSLEA